MDCQFQYVDENSTNPYTMINEVADDSLTRKVKDPIYKFIEFPRQIWRIIDLKPFQRMRYIKQLGSTSFAVNGANHTKFEHCLGVGYLAWTYIDQIAKNHQFQYQEMGLRDQAHFHKVKLLVTIAGLCHDLGHLPFNHVFDKILLPRLNEKEELLIEGRRSLFEFLLYDPQGDFIRYPIKYKEEIFNVEKDKDVVFDIIKGIDSSEYKAKYLKPFSIPEYPMWVFNIVRNHNTQIDVNKFDYFKRDSQSLDFNHEYDYLMLLGETRIIGGEICYNSKMHDDVYEIFYIRYKLFKKIYFHHATWAVELMLADALYEARTVYNYHEMINDPNKFIKLTDNIIEQILYSSNPLLQKSKAIMQRLILRDIYPFIGEVVLEQSITIDNQSIIEGIVKYTFHKEEDIEQEEEEKVFYTEEEIQQIVVRQQKLNYCQGDEDPVMNVQFFKSSSPNIKKSIHPLNSSLLRPKKFGEIILRVFVRQNDRTLINKVKSGFAQFTKYFLKKEQRDIDQKLKTQFPKSPTQNGNISFENTNDDFRENPYKILFTKNGSNN